MKSKNFKILSYFKAYFIDSDREMTARLQFCHLAIYGF